MTDTCMAVISPPPFNHPEADIILRSSDGIDFHVLKLILTLASPFFKDMFRLPQPAAGKGNDVNDGIPVIIMREDSRELDIFLRFCYPSTLAENPPLKHLADIADALEAARKYSVDLIEEKARQALVNPKILERDPFRCFAVARNARLKRETLIAARYTLRRPIVPSWFAGIDSYITASDLLALLTYHQRCSSAVASLANLDWLREHYEGSSDCKWFFGRGGMKTNSKTIRCQCEQSPFNTRFMLCNGNPMCVRAEAEKTIKKVTDSGCSTCITLAKGPRGMQEFSNLFALEVDEVTSSTDLACYYKSTQKITIQDL